MTFDAAYGHQSRLIVSEHIHMFGIQSPNYTRRTLNPKLVHTYVLAHCQRISIHLFIHSFLLYKRHDKTQANKQCTKINNIQKYAKTNNCFDIIFE